MRANGVSAGEPEAFLRRQVVIAQVGDQTERMRGIVFLLPLDDPGPRAPAPTALQRHPPPRRTETWLARRRFAWRRRDAPARRGGRTGLAPRPPPEGTPAQNEAGGEALFAGQLQAPAGDQVDLVDLAEH